MIFAPALVSVALLFHSSEYFALMVVGLSAIAAFAGSGQIGKALMMTLLGLIMATVGEGVLFNMPRFTMGIQDLQTGFGFIRLLWRCLHCQKQFSWCLIRCDRRKRGNHPTR